MTQKMLREHTRQPEDDCLNGNNHTLHLLPSLQFASFPEPVLLGR